MSNVCKVHLDFVEISIFQIVLFTTNIPTFQLVKLLVLILKSLNAHKYDEVSKSRY